MIDYENIRRAIVTGLKDYVKRPVIKQNQAAEPPEYPFISYTITTLASENKGTYGEYADGTQAKPKKQIWSISAQSGNDTESVLLINRACEWFENVGITYLSDNGIVVETVGGITNRDNLLTMDYEYRKGFDVTFVLLDVIGNATEGSGEIEEYSIGINEEDKGGE